MDLTSRSRATRVRSCPVLDTIVKAAASPLLPMLYVKGNPSTSRALTRAPTFRLAAFSGTLRSPVSLLGKYGASGTSSTVTVTLWVSDRLVASLTVTVKV